MTPLAQRVLDNLLVAHQDYYDVSRDYRFGGRLFPGYAEFHTHGEGYVLTKRAKLWQVDAHEYIFFDVLERLDMPGLEDALAFMKERAITVVRPVPDHMTSYLSLVIVADSVEDEVPHAVRRTHYRKNFMLGIRGWADLRLAVIDLSNRTVHVNGQGKDMKPLLQANIDCIGKEPCA